MSADPRIDAPSVRRSDDSPQRTLKISALIAAALIVAAGYLTFAKQLPFLGDGFEIRGDFASSNQLRSGSDVRVGGIDVGEVKRLEAADDGTTVVIEIGDEAPPIYEDASLAIRPRLPLEGKYYVDLEPGTSSSDELPEGATVPRERTRVPVQLDQLLGVFNLRTRDSMSDTFAELSEAFGGKGPGAGHRALRRTVREFERSAGPIGRVSEASRGQSPGDLTRGARGIGEFNSQLSRDPDVLAESVANFNRFFSVLAETNAPLRATISQLGSLVEEAPSQFRDVRAAMPSLRQLSDAALPVLEEAPAAFGASADLARQIGKATRPAELPGLVRELRPTTQALPVLNRRLGALFPFLDDAAQCLTETVVPFLEDDTLEDGAHTTGNPAMLELMHMAASLAGFAEAFDGNGTTLRLGVASDERALQLGIPGFGQLAGSGTISGFAPTSLPQLPGFHPQERCADQDVPRLGLESRRHSGPPPNSRLVQVERDPLKAKLREALLAGDRKGLIAAIEGMLRARGLQVPGPRKSEQDNKKRAKKRAKKRPAKRGSGLLEKLGGERTDSTLKKLGDVIDRVGGGRLDGDVIDEVAKSLLDGVGKIGGGR